MAYKMTVQFQPGGKYPFLLATEADGIPMTMAELESLHSECERALKEFDDYEGPVERHVMHCGLIWRH